jgi:DNA-binding GntR family transcriptional regulator
VSVARDPGTLVDQATAVLRERIVSCELRPGSRVHIERAAERLEMSPGPVREALRGLASEGLVVALPQRGYRVAPLSRDDFEDLFGVRVVLDLLAADRAVPRLTDADLEAMRGALEAVAGANRADDRTGQQRHHRRFHFLLFDAAGSVWLSRMLATLWDHSERYLRLSEDYRRHPPDVVGEHALLLDACRARDRALVRSRMEEHLALTHRTVLAALDAPWRADGAGVRRGESGGGRARWRRTDT